jgi:predicted phage terminase large subunit-like protein
MGEYNFAAQYQQSPVPLGGGLIKRSWLRTYEPHGRPEAFDQVLQSWDTASKPTELADWSVCTTWGIKGQNLYLLDVFRERLDYPSLRRAVKRLAQAHGATVVLIEDKSSGTQLIQDLVDEGLHGVQGYQPSGDKIMRLNAQSGTIEAGFVHVPAQAPWLDGYMLEVTSFPYAKYDDQADSTAQALDWFKRAAHFSGWGIFEYTRLQSEVVLAGKSKPEDRIRVRIPPPATNLYTITGRQIAIPDNRIIEVTEEEAPSIIANGGVRVD